jgi:2-succinyl-5-enolpyruvyl-6-hydroxy-3-cyclohexene-1-carboxylate synthase
LYPKVLEKADICTQIMQQHVLSISRTCIAAGVKHAVICPGSRSAPLVYAFTRSRITCHSVVDERSAAYMALGMAQQLGQPVVLICTSGTASLNFFPAIAEAYYQKIPLLVLTADRPPEFLNQQDGQMIAQKNVYGHHVLASYELPCYVHGKEDLKQTETIVAEALQHTLAPRKGPVHINVPLCEPLYPGTALRKEQKPAHPLTLKQHIPAFPAKHLGEISQAWKSSNRKLILIGQMPLDAALTGALTELQKQPDTVIVSDLLSNQFSFNTAPSFDYMLLRSGSKTREALEPDCIVSFGGPVLSKPLKQWLQKISPAYHFRINAPGETVDTYKNVTHHLEGDPASLVYRLPALPVRADNEDSYYKQFWTTAGDVAGSAVNTFVAKTGWSELHAMNFVLRQIPDAANVQVGNSSIIRYMSYLANINPSWTMNGNRGTSGIDGCSSTAVGAAIVNNRPTVLLSGDIAFLYDINALWQNRLPHNLKFIVFNNNGGGIFELIEGPSAHPAELSYFTTPHQQDLEQIALQKGLEYYFCGSADDRQSTRSFFSKPGPALLEIRCDRKKNADMFRSFKQTTL